MEYRKLGKTDMHLSVIGFGASPLGDVFDVTNEQEGVRAVHTAIDSGINFFDVAPFLWRHTGRNTAGQGTGR